LDIHIFDLSLRSPIVPPLEKESYQNILLLMYTSMLSRFTCVAVLLSIFVSNINLPDMDNYCIV